MQDEELTKQRMETRGIMLPDLLEINEIKKVNQIMIASVRMTSTLPLDHLM